jgi:hypothetical protein
MYLTQTITKMQPKNSISNYNLKRKRQITRNINDKQTRRICLLCNFELTFYIPTRLMGKNKL